MFCVSLIFNFHFSIFNFAFGQYTVTHLESPFNTPGSETGAFRVGDTVMVYSSMPPEVGRNSQFDISSPVMQVYQARIAKNGRVARPKADRWGLNSKRDHTGNLAFDPWTQDIYFTRGDVETLHCDIWFAKKKRRRGWEKPVKLQGPVPRIVSFEVHDEPLQAVAAWRAECQGCQEVTVGRQQLFQGLHIVYPVK
ncbi:MAG: hypothetical protein ACSW8I_08570, partial [bacterium]